MKYVVWIAIAIAAIYFGRNLFGPSAPSVREVEPLVREFLENGDGQCTVEHLSDVSVGKYTEQMGGWPVYASHQETCRRSSTTATNATINASTTNVGLDDARKAVAVAFARRTSGKVELFVPAVFQQGQQQMQQAMQNGFDNMKVQVGRTN
jgi:hypothetical protein